VVLGAGNGASQVPYNSAPYDELYNFSMDPALDTLLLQLNIVNPLKDVSGSGVPYLEWQLVTDSTRAFADTKAMIVGEGYYAGFGQNYYYYELITRPTVGKSANIYTLSN
jgi:hypothetical protein